MVHKFLLIILNFCCFVIKTHIILSLKKIVFFLLSDISIQKIIKDKLLSLCKVSGNQEEKYKGTIAPQSSLNCFFFSLFVNEFLLKLDFFHYRERCYHFFDFLHFLGMNVKDQHIENLTRLVDFPHLFQFLLELFQNLPIFEKNQGEPDFLLQGILKIFQILLRFCNSFKEELLKHDSFMKELSHKCLFEMPSCFFFFLIFRFFF